MKQGVGGRDDGDVERIFADVNAEEVRVPKKERKKRGGGNTRSRITAVRCLDTLRIGFAPEFLFEENERPPTGPESQDRFSPGNRT